MATRIFSTAIRAGLAFAALFFVACGDDDPRSGDCLDGQLMCGDMCTSVQTNFQNCGSCGNSCLMGQTCNAGTCDGVGTGCDNPSETQCGDSCVDTMSNSTNCGGCGIPCLAGTSCIGGVCGGAGPDGGAGFDGGAVDAGGGDAGMCGAFRCGPNQTCISRGGSPICADLMFDNMNCGAVGNACQEGESCTNGVCGCGGGAACVGGEACCFNAAGVQACIDASSDGMNCGGCGISCGEGASCNGGACGCGAGPACRAPSTGDGGGLPIPIPGAGDPGESCCAGACVPNDEASCGCGIMCTGDDTCQAADDGGLIMPTGNISVCCGGSLIAATGCGGGIGFP